LAARDPFTYHERGKRSDGKPLRSPFRVGVEAGFEPGVEADVEADVEAVSDGGHPPSAGRFPATTVDITEGHT